MTPRGLEDTSRTSNKSGLHRIASILWKTGGWLAVLLVLGSEVANRSGLTRGLAEAALQRSLPPGSPSVDVRSARLQWLRRTLVLRGVTFSKQRLERIELTLGKPWQPWKGLRRVHVSGGVLQWEELPKWPDNGQESPKTPLPEVSVEGLQLALPGRNGPLTLGTLRLALVRQKNAYQLRANLERQLDSGTVGRVLLSGSLDENEVWNVSAEGRELPLELLQKVRPELVGELSGQLDFRLESRSAPGQNSRVQARVRSEVERCELAPDLFLEAGSLDLWVENEGRWPVQDPRAWLWRGSAAGFLQDVPFRGGLERRPQGDPQAWFHLEDLPLGAELERRLPGVPQLEELNATLTLGGNARVRAGLRMPQPASFAELSAGELEYAISFDPAQTSSLAYVGRVSRLRGRRDLGFPLPGRAVTGRVVVAGGPTGPWLSEIGLIDLETQVQTNSVVRGVGCLYKPQPGAQLPPGSSPNPPEEGYFQLILTSPDLQVDREVQLALEGLSGILPPERTWERYQPSEGSSQVRVELWAGPHTPGVATRVELDLRDIGMAWSPLPVRLHSGQGRLVVTSDGRRSFEGGANIGVSLALQARSAMAQGPIELELFLRQRLIRPTYEDPLEVLFPAEWLRIRLPGVDPKHPELKRALDQSPLETLQQLMAVDVDGPLDLVVRHGREPGARRGALEVEIVPRPGSSVRAPWLEPAFEDLQGRLLLSLADRRPEDSEAPEVQLRAAPLIAAVETETTPIEVEIQGTATPTGRADLTLDVAGLSTRRSMVLDSLLESFGFPAGDMHAMGVLVDVEGRARLRANPAEDEPLDLKLWAYAREGSLVLESPGGEARSFVDAIDGRVEYDGSMLRAPRLSGRFLGSTVKARDLVLDPAKPSVNLQLSAQRLPLDRETLAYLLPPEVLESLLGDLALRSELEDLEADLTLAGSAERPRIEVRGSLGLGPTSLRLGVPIQIAAARIPEYDLRMEDGRLRFWARTEEVFGRIAGRKVDSGAMLMSYIQPHLSLRDLEARFAGGSLRTDGMEGRGSEPFFSIDLAPPYPFALSAQLRDVEAGELLQGLFQSNFANRGRVAADLDLQGDLGRLTGISGDGSLRLTDSSLWAIPVFQALFNQLGFETTATFQNMETKLRFEDGRIQMDDMRLESDLLSLVGSGWMDLDGRLSNDLEVRYSLVDRLGPLNYLLYWIQNGLLRVFVRGDLHRPRVQLGGLLSMLLGRQNNVDLRLPLPGVSKLPARF